MDTESERITFDSLELSSFGETIGRIDLPQPYVPQRRDFVVEVARKLGKVAPQKVNAGRSKRRSRGTNTDVRRLRREIEQLSARQSAVTGAVSRHFNDVVALMTRHGYTDQWDLTGKGRQLRNVFHELDLLVVESLASGLLDDLMPLDLAVLVSGFVYEPRGRDEDGDDWLPSNEVRRRSERILRLHARLNDELESYGLQSLRTPNFTLARSIVIWGQGKSLRAVLDDDAQSGGDFVRTARNLVDLLTQIRDVALSSDTQRCAQEAIELLDRGVVRLAAGVA